MSSSEAEVPDRPDDDLTLRHESGVPIIATTDRRAAMSNAEVDTTLPAPDPQDTGEPTTITALDPAELVAQPDAPVAIEQTADKVTPADTAIAPPPAAP